jgi:hypothetical protein
MNFNIKQCLFHRAEVLEGVDKSGWFGMVLLTKSFVVKCVKLCNEPLPMEGTATVIAEGAGAPELPVLNSEETLEPVTASAPAVKAASIQQGQEAVQGYTCLPWRVEAVDSSKGPSWDNEVSNYRAAAACGVSPAFHGSCIIHHGDKQLYARLKNCTGLFLNAPWLHNLVCTELRRKLHGSSPHTESPVGCLVMSRVPYTLASYHGDPQGLDAKDLNGQLQGLHWCAIAHGLVHADFRPANLGLTQQQQLRLLDWGGSTSSVCLEKLPKAAADAVLLCLQQLTKGVIEDAIAKLGHKRHASADDEKPSRWWPFV